MSDPETYKNHIEIEGAPGNVLEACWRRLGVVSLPPPPPLPGEVKGTLLNDSPRLSWISPPGALERFTRTFEDKLHQRSNKDEPIAIHIVHAPEQSQRVVP